MGSSSRLRWIPLVGSAERERGLFRLDRRRVTGKEGLQFGWGEKGGGFLLDSCLIGQVLFRKEGSNGVRQAEERIKIIPSNSILRITRELLPERFGIFEETQGLSLFTTLAIKNGIEGPTLSSHPLSSKGPCPVLTGILLSADHSTQDPR